MTQKPNHICKVCGSEYYACNKCNQYNNWRAVACTPEHYQIYQICVMFSRNMIDTSEAANMLNSIDAISSETHFTESTSNILHQILD